ncbi:uncharacterized protein BDZ99DRAFT_475143 [Mytilinidion resinicola]|uniref:C2H2-type domain-containing protein n=1 Tax=Mytilinidion resinicola TaxID=574789 RepID=A0A6A6YUJ0_9PEZI|nr:uncharacterized protein BDZ99DRAFT_475143 [Mytilinidion resinicola]KAF2811607.1 hypothetical protein BDZ99DRAFT_475143 [Mytilinidion resinicola]
MEVKQCIERVKDQLPAPKVSRSSVTRPEQTIAPLSPPRTRTDLRQLVQSISFTVTCLWRIPIRRPAPIDRIKRKGAANTSYYQPFDILYVKDKFPHVDESVANRLDNLISKRRQVIQYRKRHTDALQSAAAESEHTAERRVAKFSGTTGVGSPTAPSKSAPSRQTQKTKATTLKLAGTEMEPRDVSRLYAPSMPESRTTVASDQAANNERVAIPPRPIGGNGKTLEQFGRSLLISQEWFNHETHHHRLEWSCNIHDHQSFAELSDFLEHMARMYDSAFDERQIKASRGMFQRPAQSHSGVCTLCYKEATKLKIHVSRHLEQMSLFAIPPADMMEDLDSDISGSGLSHMNINGSKAQNVSFKRFGSISRLSDKASDQGSGALAGTPHRH